MFRLITEDGNDFDPVSLHRYQYANANPVSFADPSGRYTALETLVSVAIGTTLGAISAPKLYRALSTARNVINPLNSQQEVAGALLAVWTRFLFNFSGGIVTQLLTTKSIFTTEFSCGGAADRRTPIIKEILDRYSTYGKWEVKRADAITWGFVHTFNVIVYHPDDRVQPDEYYVVDNYFQQPFIGRVWFSGQTATTPFGETGRLLYGSALDVVTGLLDPFALVFDIGLDGIIINDPMDPFCKDHKRQ